MIKYQKNGELSYGYTSITKENDFSENMLMDIDIYRGKKDEKLEVLEPEKEVAVLLLEGEVEFQWEEHKLLAKRENVFDFEPYALHVCSHTKIVLEFHEDSEVLIQKASNNRAFSSKMYTPDQCVENIFGETGMQGTAKRLVRDIFNYDNAPYSNMVLGEVITLPGKWSSYPPHSHEQPEVYFYKFTKKQGFGAGYVGEQVYLIKHNSALLIKGGVTHPQTAAPGYGMYYCWMIRHLEQNPRTSREYDKEHLWLLEEDQTIWEPKKEF